MSHTNTTTNYGLPQFLSSDKPAWMADINVAFSDIDGQMKTNADAASAAQTTADDAVLNGAPGYSNLSTYAVGDVVNYLGRVYKCDIAVTTPEAFDNSKWSYYRLSDASAQLDVIDGEIGSTDISSVGDGSITGAISTINSNSYNLATDVYSPGVALISTNIASPQYLTPSQPFTNFTTIKVRIGAYYTVQNANIYMQAFDIDLRHINGAANEFMYSWYISDTNFMSVAFGIQNGKLSINSIDLGSTIAQNFAVYVEAYGYKQTL